MNDARMTIRLPGEALDFARQYASESQMTLSELVLRYFERIREIVMRKDDAVPRSVVRVAGIIPDDVDAEAEYRAHLSEKYL